MAVLDLVIGRQPIFDRERRVVGYELLFREVETQAVPRRALDGDLMTATVLYGSLGIGIDRVVGDKLVFCNADTGVLTGDIPMLLPPHRTVLEVLETVEPTDEVVEGCRRLVRQGYRIALDDFVFVEGIEPLLELSSVVKVDILLVTGEELSETVSRLGEHGVQLLAEKVETDEQLERCSSLGFDLFQGYLLSRPRLVAGRTLDSSSLARLQLAARLLEGERDLAEIERIVRAEPALAYQLLQLAGLGAAGGLRRTVSTLREALVLLGWRKLQSWVAYLLVSMRGTTSEEDVVTALTRARMCELLAAEVDPALAGAAFAAGMLSALDLLLDVPLSEALASVSIDEELRSAILTGEGPLGRLLADVVDHRLGSSVVTPRSGVDRHRLDVTGMAALTWAVEVARGALAPPPEGDARAVP